MEGSRAAVTVSLVWTSSQKQGLKLDRLVEAGLGDPRVRRSGKSPASGAEEELRGLAPKAQCREGYGSFCRLPPSLAQPLCSLPSFPISFMALFLRPWFQGHDSSATLAPIPPLPNPLGMFWESDFFKLRTKRRKLHHVKKFSCYFLFPPGVPRVLSGA